MLRTPKIFWILWYISLPYTRIEIHLTYWSIKEPFQRWNKRLDMIRYNIWIKSVFCLILYLSKMVKHWTVEELLDISLRSWKKGNIGLTFTMWPLHVCWMCERKLYRVTIWVYSLSPSSEQKQKLLMQVEVDL